MTQPLDSATPVLLEHVVDERGIDRCDTDRQRILTWAVHRSELVVLSPAPMLRLCAIPGLAASSSLPADHPFVCWLSRRIYITRNVASFLFNHAHSMGRSLRAASDKSHVITTDTIRRTLVMLSNKHDHQQTPLRVCIFFKCSVCWTRPSNKTSRRQFHSESVWKFTSKKLAKASVCW